MLATFVHCACAIDYTPAADVAAGDVVVQGDLVGVAKRPIPATTPGSLCIEGAFDFAKATGNGTAITAGTKAYWDAANKHATADAAAGANKYLGKAIKDAADADAKVRVRLQP